MTKLELIIFTIGVILWFIYVIWSLKKGVNPFTIWEEEKDENAAKEGKQNNVYIEGVSFCRRSDYRIIWCFTWAQIKSRLLKQLAFFITISLWLYFGALECFFS